MDVPRIDVVIIVLALSLDVPRRTRRSEYTAGGGAPWPTIGRTDADRLGARPYRSKRKNRSRHKRFRDGLAFSFLQSSSRPTPASPAPVVSAPLTRKS